MYACSRSGSSVSVDVLGSTKPPLCLGLREGPIYQSTLFHTHGCYLLHCLTNPPFPPSHNGGPAPGKEDHVSVHLQPCQHHVIQGEYHSSDIAPSNVASAMGSLPLMEAAIALTGRSQGLTPSSALPPVPAKIVTKIQAGQFIQ